jgi:hypothetical protein
MIQVFGLYEGLEMQSMSVYNVYYRDLVYIQ